MATVKEIFEALNKFAPVERKMDFDNVGFLVGAGENEVQKILVALDITDEVISEATEERAQLIVSHHPMFFSLKAVTDSDGIGRKIVNLLSRGIAAVCMHTNLDAADGGVNDALASAVGLTDTEILVSEGVDSNGIAYCCGRVGLLKEPATLEDFLKSAKTALNANGLRYVDGGKPVSKVAVVGGSGGSYLKTAFEAGCDTLLTADVKYDVFLEAKEMGINLIDGDHFCTENTVVPVLQMVLCEKFPEIETIISTRHSQCASFF